MFDHSSPLSKFNSNEFLISVFRQLRHHHPTSPSSRLLPLAENVRVLKEHHLYVFSGFDFRPAVFRQKHLVAGRHGTWNQCAGLSSKTRTDRDHFRVEDLEGDGEGGAGERRRNEIGGERRGESERGGEKGGRNRKKEKEERNSLKSSQPEPVSYLNVLSRKCK